MPSFIRHMPAVAVAALCVGPARAEMLPTPGLWGNSGLIDMPSGEAMPDGTFSFSGAAFGPVARSTLTFQITPWMSGSFRLQNTRNWNAVYNDPSDPSNIHSSYNDRSFDLRFHLLRESEWQPSVTVGLQDIAGTGVVSGEYLAATKTFDDRLKLTAGLGWGRLGSYNSIGSPFGARPAPEVGRGGRPNPDTWFKGPAALFGGVEWKASDKWTFKAEYSSDAYETEAALRQTFDRASPFNFGVEYQLGRYARLGLYSLYGSEVGISFHAVVNPKNRVTVGVMGPAPVGVGQRPSRGADPEAWDGGWVAQADADAILRRNLAGYLERDGIFIEDFAYSAGRVQIRIRNTTFDAAAQAVGRTARALSHVMPASVEVFEIVPVESGMAASKVTLRRSDLEALEHVAGSDSALRGRVTVTAAEPGTIGRGPQEGLYPKFSWSLLPTARTVDPLRGDIGLRLAASYEMRPGLVFSGSVYKRLGDNFDKLDHLTHYTGLPPVRSDVEKYTVESGLTFERLNMAWYAHPVENIYTRLTLGYIERMHAGVSGEVLWKPVDSRLAFGAELNYTKQRDRDGGFSFNDYDYAIATGHVSAYYDLGNGFLGQIDVGRYLAGDLGATVSIDREFGNGWRVGAFATLTDVSADVFGEGSFDKGIRVTVPFNWFLGQPTRQEFSTLIRPLQRDGGARLDVENRLYDVIRDQHVERLDDQWSRVWR
ncbi:YjbH domain-containing protein [Pseudogemmobacter sonorensis]|uniref:YjbH domain-containing protein n=1 Tax=Pseudogemmobacter sonorensis TaxID=2989681 RepID=UPI0036ACC764